MDTSGIRVGDDITISGTVEATYYNRILIASTGTDGITRRYWIYPEDVKAVRPHGNGGK